MNSGLLKYSVISGFAARDFLKQHKDDEYLSRTSVFERVGRQLGETPLVLGLSGADHQHLRQVLHVVYSREVASAWVPKLVEVVRTHVRGWKPGRFSFNVSGGRCETCQGNGEIAVEMHFLPTVYVPCDVCDGKRFTKETLEVKYKKKSIYDVLEMTVEEATEFFKDIPAIADRLKTLGEVGLEYLKLGQSATTLSGGEAQRIKVSSELYRPHLQRTIYLLDEPTIGLHYEDVKKLIEILQRLVDKGNTVILIEHNMDVIKSSDYLIDIGPEGGSGGGRIVAKGTPEQVANAKGSYTGDYLKRVLKK